MSFLERYKAGNLADPFLQVDLRKFPDFRKRTNNVMLIQYQHSVNLKNYLSAFVDVWEDIEYALVDVIYKRYLTYATAAQLDDVGIIVGVSRTLPGAKPVGYFGYYENAQAQLPSVGDDNIPDIGGILKGDLDPDSQDFVLADKELRQLILAKVIKNSSFCNVEDVINFTETLLGRVIDIETVESTDRNHAHLIIHETLNLTERAVLACTIKMMKAAGIEYTMEDGSGQISLIGQDSSIAPYSRFLESLQL